MQTFRQNRVVWLLIAALPMFAQQPPAVDAALLKKAGTPADPFPGSWLTYGKSQSETRYSPLKRIDTSNVKRLGLEWSYVAGAGGYNQEATPLVWNNTIYGITNWSVVFALDARTGKEIWRWDPRSISLPRALTRIADWRSTTGRSSLPATMDGCLRSTP